MKYFVSDKRIYKVGIEGTEKVLYFLGDDCAWRTLRRDKKYFSTSMHKEYDTFSEAKFALIENLKAINKENEKLIDWHMKCEVTE